MSQVFYAFRHPYYTTVLSSFARARTKKLNFCQAKILNFFCSLSPRGALMFKKALFYWGLVELARLPPPDVGLAVSVSGRARRGLGKGRCRASSTPCAACWGLERRAQTAKYKGKCGAILGFWGVGNGNRLNRDCGSYTIPSRHTG